GSECAPLHEPAPAERRRVAERHAFLQPVSPKIHRMYTRPGPCGPSHAPSCCRTWRATRSEASHAYVAVEESVQEHAQQAPKKMGERMPMLCSNSIQVVFLPRRSEIHHRYLMFVFVRGSDVPNGRRETSERKLRHLPGSG